MKKLLGILAIFFSFAAQASNDPITLHILGVNDFHGQISSGRQVNNRPAGSAPVLASYLRTAEKGKENSTVIALIGDQVGASTPASSLLLDEPTVLFFNTLANSYCSTDDRTNPKCNMVGTIGNHEFDRTPQTMFEMIYGRDTPPTNHWIDLPKFPGSSFPYVSANIVDAKTGKNLFPPYVIKQIQGVPVAFIGAILKNAPDVILPTNIKDIKFLDEAESINQYIPEIKAKGVNVIVVLIHQGGFQTPYEGPTQQNTQIQGPIVDVVKKLDDSVDVVMSAHTHNFTNGFLTNEHGKKILVTQANSYSTAFADVTLQIDPKTLSVFSDSATITTTYADQTPGTNPDPDAKKILDLAEASTGPIINNPIGVLQKDLLRRTNEAGESNLGDLVADAAKKSMDAQISFYQPGGIRADLYAGKITWGDAYSVAPFGNQMAKMTFSGNDIYDLLEQQWTLPNPIILQESGLRYVYDLKNPVGHRIVSVTLDGKPLDRTKTYTVSTIMFLALGGDGFTVMKRGTITDAGVLEYESLINYIKSLPQPFSQEIDGRIQKN